MYCHLISLLCCLLAVRAQVPDYTCTPTTNCNKYTLNNRCDVLACLFFCRMDTNENNALDQTEFSTPFMNCAGSSGACDEATFVARITAALPICDNEAHAMWRCWAAKDGTVGTLAATDIYAIWQEANPTGAAEVTPAGFWAMWIICCIEFQDEATCALAYP